MRSSSASTALAILAATALFSSTGCKYLKGKPKGVDGGAADASALAVTVDASAASASAGGAPAFADGGVIAEAGVAAGAEADGGAAAGGALVVDTGDGTALEAWVNAREAIAGGAAGPELVRVPLIRHGVWGCICPEHYVGTTTTTAGEKAVWIKPVWAKTAHAIKAGSVVIAEGYFSGKTTPFEAKTEEAYDKVPMHELHVLRTRAVGKAAVDELGASEDGKAAVLDPSKDAKPAAPKPKKDAKP